MHHLLCELMSFSPQAFSSRVFYNVDSGFFEQVHGEGVTGWVEDGVTPSTSVATLYLTDEAVGPVSGVLSL